MTKNTKLTALLLAMALLCGCGSSQTGYDPLAGVETKTVTDSSGRSVEVPAEITRVAPSGSTAQMLLMPIAYDLLVGLSSSPSTAQRPYFPEEMWYLPTFGQFYGSKASLNMEALIAAQPQVILDLGDAKESIADDMDRIQKQTGIPTLFIEADLDDMAAAYRMLGSLLGRETEAEPLAAFIEETVAMAQANAALGTWRLEDCDLYVTLEPCPMCAGAIINARVRRVFYGARDRAMGACGGVLNLFMESFPHHPQLVGGILAEDCQMVLSEFFKGLRK